MIMINQLSAVGHVVSKQGREICKINKTCDGWVIRGGPLNGKEFRTATTAGNAINNHFDQGQPPVDTDPPIDRGDLIHRLTSAVEHLEQWQQVMLLTSTMTTGELKKLTEMQERCIE